MTADLLARLRAAIDDAERIARAAERTVVCMAGVVVVVVTDDGMAAAYKGTAADHIAANGPDVVLRRCAADRRIVDLHARAHECSQYDHRGDIDNCSWVMEVEYEVCDTVRALADAYGVAIDGSA